MIWLAFFIVALVIVWSGSNLSRLGDQIAEVTGLGRSWIGLILLATATSLPELFTGISSVLQDLPDIAVGNVLGACLVNFLVLGIILIVDRGRSGLSPAQSSHLVASSLGILALSLAGSGLVVATAWPALGWIGIPTILIFIIYFISMRLLYKLDQAEAQKTSEELGPSVAEPQNPRPLYRSFGLNALAVIIAASFLPTIAEQIAANTGLAQAWVGNIFVALVTTLPEMVVSVTALRLGAIDMAIGNLLGSNLFNLMLLGIDDLIYSSGFIMEAANSVLAITALGTIAMAAVLIFGIVWRASGYRLRFPWDALAMVALYAGTVTLLTRMS